MQVHGIKSKLPPTETKSLNLLSFSNILRQLSFEAHDSFPSMVKVLSLNENKRFGKHLIANSNIDVGDCIMAAPAFASIEYLVRTGLGCFECGEVTECKIQCSHCIDIWFCSDRCRKSENHQQKCDPLFESSDCRIVRLTTQIITTAFNSVVDISSMLEFCRGLLLHNKKSNKCHPPYSEYGEILTLKGQPNPVDSKIARRVVKYIMQQHQFESVSLNVQELKRILFTIAYRHANSIPINAFDENVKCSEGGAYVRLAIFNVLCRINHSCNPNLDHYIDDDDVTYCVANRPIKTGEQLFINYFGDLKFESTEERKKHIRENWHFECKCQLCYSRSS